MVNAILNYIPKKSIIHSLTGTTKLFIFLLLSFVSIYTFDMRILFGLFVFCAICDVRYRGSYGIFIGNDKLPVRLIVQFYYPLIY